MPLPPENKSELCLLLCASCSQFNCFFAPVAHNSIQLLTIALGWELLICQAEVIISGLATSVEKRNKYALPSFILRMDLANYQVPHGDTQWTGDGSIMNSQNTMKKGTLDDLTWLLRWCTLGSSKHLLNLSLCSFQYPLC